MEFVSQSKLSVRSVCDCVAVGRLWVLGVLQPTVQAIQFDRESSTSNRTGRATFLDFATGWFCAALALCLDVGRGTGHRSKYNKCYQFKC